MGVAHTGGGVCGRGCAVSLFRCAGCCAQELLGRRGDVLGVDPGRCEELGRACPRSASRGRRGATIRGRSSASANAESTASPRPPSGQWSSTVTRRRRSPRPRRAASPRRSASPSRGRSRARGRPPPRASSAAFSASCSVMPAPTIVDLVVVGRADDLAPADREVLVGPVDDRRVRARRAQVRRSRRGRPSAATSLAVWFASEG